MKGGEDKTSSRHSRKNGWSSRSRPSPVTCRLGERSCSLVVCLVRRNWLHSLTRFRGTSAINALWLSGNFHSALGRKPEG